MDSLGNYLSILAKSYDEAKVIRCLDKIEETLSLFSVDFHLELAAEKSARVLEKHRETLNKYIRGATSNKLVLFLFRHQELLDFDIKIKFLEAGCSQLSDTQLCDLLEETLTQLEIPSSKYPVKKTPAVFLLISMIQDKNRLFDVSEKHQRTLNTLLRDNTSHLLIPKINEVLSAKPGLIDEDTKFKWLKIKLSALSQSEKKEKLNECLKFLQMVRNEKIAVEVVPTIGILFSDTVGDLTEEIKKLLDIAEHHKNNLNNFLRRHNCLKLFTILHAKSELFEFDVTCKYISQGGIEDLKMWDFLGCCLNAINADQRYSATLKYLPPITDIFRFMGNSDNRKLITYAEKYKSAINEFCRKNVCDPAYDFLLRNPNLLDFDLRASQVVKNTNGMHTQGMAYLLEDGLKILEANVDKKSVELVLKSIGQLFPPNYDQNYDETRDRFVHFASNNKDTMNEVFSKLNNERNLLFGAVMRVLGSNHDILDFKLKFPKSHYIVKYMDADALWLFLYECLQSIEETDSIETILYCVRSIRVGLQRKCKRFQHDEFTFAEKHKDLINRIMYEKISGHHRTFFEIIEKHPTLIEKRNKRKFAKELLPSLEKAEKWEMFEECLCELENESTDALHEEGKSILMSIFPVGCLECDDDHKKLKECSESHEEEFKKLVSGLKNKLLTSRIMAILTGRTALFRFERKAAELRTKLDSYKAPNAVSLTIDRKDLVRSSFEQTSRLHTGHWRNEFIIRFDGERGIDAGGLRREWYTVLTREVFNPNYALFTATSDDNNCYTINRASQVNPDHLEYFSFVGKVIAKCIMERQYINCRFTKAFYKHVLGIPVTYEDFEKEDPTFFKSLNYILNNPVEELDLTFTTEVEAFGELYEKELKDDGKNIAVTDENKEDYVRLLCKMKMSDSICFQLEAFCDGFYQVMPKHYIQGFDENELELLICGQPEIDINDLRDNTKYMGCSESDVDIQWFWKALESFEEEDKAKFLIFVTGSSNAPLNGFADLRGIGNICKFTISKNRGTENKLPTAHTCFNTLFLPHYDTYENLLNSLLIAIREGAEGYFGS